MGRTLLLLLLLIIALLTRPWVRNRLLQRYGAGSWRTLKQNLVIVLILYFLVSLGVTLYKYGLLR